LSEFVVATVAAPQTAEPFNRNDFPVNTGAAAMSNDAVAITNLLYRYAELIDAGDFAGVSALFTHADVMVGGEVLHGAEPMLKLWHAHTKLHADGTPRTKHVVTNAIVEIAPDQLSATTRSYYTVLQATGTVPLQVIAAGRYHDGFEKVDGAWRFARRDYTMLDLKGDLSDHLLINPS
jgi:3-phenylpropionate/cinnamic acid dioxygenase small subunit